MSNRRPGPVAQHLPELLFGQARTGGEKLAQRFRIASLPWHFRRRMVLCAPVLRQDAAKGHMPAIGATFLRNDSLEEGSVA
jgi:hypothetical protein